MILASTNLSVFHASYQPVELAAQLVADQVVEVLADRDSIPASQALSTFSKSALYARLLDPETELWHENPHDIAAMFEFESKGEDIPPEMYFK